MTTGRIDLHQHLVPRGYPEAFAAAGGGHALPEWSPAGALAMMDEHAIATGVLSLSTPGTHFGDDAAARQLTEQINDTHAELVKDRPDRFGMFATLPLPDVDGALAAIAHAYDELRTDGVILLTNYRGTYLGDPAFDPVLDPVPECEPCVVDVTGCVVDAPGAVVDVETAAPAAVVAGMPLFNTANHMPSTFCPCACPFFLSPSKRYSGSLSKATCQ